MDTSTVLTIPCPRCEGTGRIADPKAYGEAIRRVRLGLGFSLRKVAGRAKISAQYLFDIEHGRRAGSTRARAAIEKALR